MAFVERAGELDAADRVGEPVHGEDAGRDRDAADVSGAGVEAGGELDAALVVEVVERLEATLVRGAGRLERPGQNRARDMAPARASGARRPGRAAPRTAEGEVLLEARLRQPEPQVPGPGHRRDADLREGSGLARIEDRLLQPRHEAARLPLDLHGRGADASGLVVCAGEEVHEDRAVDRCRRRSPPGPRNSSPTTVWRTVAPEVRGPVGWAVTGYCAPPLCFELRKALNSAMPVRRRGNFWDDSTLVCARSSVRRS